MPAYKGVFLTPGYTLGRFDGRVDEVGHANTRKTMADSRFEK